MSEISIILILLGFMLMLAALFWMRFPPAKINYIYGYRTGNSMKNEDTWKEANRYSTRLLLKIAAIETFIGIIFLFLPVYGSMGIVSAIAVIICGFVFLIWRTEKHLHRVFDKDGARRS